MVYERRVEQVQPALRRACAHSLRLTTGSWPPQQRDHDLRDRILRLHRSRALRRDSQRMQLLSQLYVRSLRMDMHALREQRVLLQEEQEKQRRNLTMRARAVETVYPPCAPAAATAAAAAVAACALIAATGFLHLHVQICESEAAGAGSHSDRDARAEDVRVCAASGAPCRPGGRAFASHRA